MGNGSLFPGLLQHIDVATGVGPFEAYSDVLFCQPYNWNVPSNTQLLHEMSLQHIHRHPRLSEAVSDTFQKSFEGAPQTVA